MFEYQEMKTIKLIFQLYISGLGCKKVAHYLNEREIETPSIHKQKKFGFGWKPDWTQKELWYASSVKRILINDAYIGTLRCGVTKLIRMKGKKVNAPEREHFVFPNYFEPIIDKKDFELVQKIMKSRVNNNVRAKNERIHRYAGILKCGDCNKGFVARRSNHKNGDVRITYVCATFHRYGSKYCGSHRLFEDEIDSLVVTELRRRLVESQERIKNLDKNVEERLNRKKDFDKLIHNVTIEIEKKKQEIKNYSRQLARNMIDEGIFDEMVTEANQQLDKQIKYLQELERQKDNCENEKEYLVNSIEVIEDILENNKLTNADILNLIDDITLWETEETGKVWQEEVKG